MGLEIDDEILKLSGILNDEVRKSLGYIPIKFPLNIILFLGKEYYSYSLVSLRDP